ncbi:MAG: hypothetical protein D6693_06140 [Planctomycetota bacterium]|nr:MAG: hypothetical protein D6693_06140 [Planctomycetota bacterium]
MRAGRDVGPASIGRRNGCPGVDLRVPLLLIALSAGFVAGCQRALYLPNDTRTPYDRYRRARGELSAPFTEDEYGRRTPNLRERLNPPD